MAGFDLGEFDGPTSGRASKRPVRSRPSSDDVTAEARLVIDAWARHAAASGGFAEAAVVPDERPGPRGRKRR